MANDNEVFLASRKKGVHYFGPAIDREMSAEEAFDLAGLLGWDVRKDALYLADGTEMPSHFATTRVKNGHRVPLGVVGARYVPEQNEWLMRLAQDVLDSGDVIAEAVGATHGGARVFASFRIPEGVTIDGEPGGVDTSLFIGSSHDGSLPKIAKVLHTRWVCTNQINGILGNRSAPEIKLRHTSGSDSRTAEVRQALRIAFDARDRFAEQARRMLDATVNEDQFEQIVAGLFPVNEDMSAGAVTRAENRREGLREVYNLSDTQQSIHGTAWGVVNAVVEWDDWHRSVRSDEARALGMLGGRDREKRAAVLTVADVLGRPDLVAV